MASRTTKKATTKKARKKTAKKKVVKKTSTRKKAATRKTTAKKKRAAPAAPLTKEQKLRQVEALLNEPGKPPTITRASESNTSYLLRRPTGIMSLDLALAGGFPASAPVMITGPDGAGKDYLLWRTAAEQQRIYGDDFAMAMYMTEFKMDKPFARDKCGLRVAMTPDEMDEYDLALANQGKPPLTDEERERYAEKIGTIHLIEGRVAEYGFDALIECIKTGLYQICGVNSVGFLQTLAKENTESYEKFAQQRNEAILLSKFFPQLSLYLNRPLEDGGGRNETTVMLIDQVRSTDQQKKPMKGRPVQEKDKYRPARNVWAMKHGLAITVALHKGKTYWDEVTKEKLGRVTNWELIKGKLGTHDGIRGQYNYFYETGADIIGDLFTVATDLGVLDVSGSWYSLDDPATDLSFKAQGKPGVRRALLESEELRARMHYLCLQQAEVLYRHK